MTHPKLAVVLAAVLFAGGASTALAQRGGGAPSPGGPPSSGPHGENPSGEKPLSGAPPARSLADIKEETEAGIPYQPCPANVRFPNGQQMCLGLPGFPSYRPYHAPKQH